MIFKFKIQIEGISKPPVWRRVEAPASLTFSQFHQVIQTVFDWGNAHLWNFSPRSGRGQSPRFYIEDPELNPDSWWTDRQMAASETMLSMIFPKHKELVYTYDYGDDWKHSVKLEEIIEGERECAVCTGGKGATPPEDCGGIYGYADLKRAFEEHDEEGMARYREWLFIEDDDEWDPYFFCEEELTEINMALRRIKAPVDKRARSAAGKQPKADYWRDPHYITLRGLLKSKTVKELRSIALYLGFRFKSAVPKEDMINDLVKIMTEKPQSLLTGAFYYELKAFLDIIKGNMTLQYAEESGLLFELNRFGVIYALDRIEGSASTLHFQMDLADILEPLIPAELERRERDGSLLFEKLALGCANIYGYTEMYYLQKHIPTVEKLVGRKFDDAELAKLFHPILADMETSTNKKKGLLLSPFSQFVDFHADEEHIDFDIAPKKYDFDTILKYGEMPYPQFPGKEADALRKIAGQYGKAGCNADEALRSIWIRHQDFSNKSLLPDLDLFSSTADLPSCIEAITEFQNNAPCWKFAGNSSSDIFKARIEANKGRMPHIAIGPNMRAMGVESYEQLKEMARNNKDLAPLPFKSPVKAGRNDPCPCGSGKKYKHCCGRDK